MEFNNCGEQPERKFLKYWVKKILHETALKSLIFYTGHEKRIIKTLLYNWELDQE
jgi:hypothetical protein